MISYLVQKININGQVIEGPLKAPVGITGVAGINTLSDIVNILVQFLYPLAGMLLFVYLVWGGFDYLLSRGNPEKVKSGKAKITAALIGFILLVASYTIVRLIVHIFGLQGGVIQ